MTLSSHTLSRPGFVVCQSVLAQAVSVAEQSGVADNRARDLVMFTRAILTALACALFAHQHESVDFTKFTPQIREDDFTLFTMHGLTWHVSRKDLRCANLDGCLMKISPGTNATTGLLATFFF